ncbi:hypothetical protein M514_10870 [Trichuris suis]|uniref:Abnormal cell migration protein 18-like fibronectin type I domain-containing protein n=1 Tax=Trichuris suis TaxID=68888 RepID=A0A085NK11_9BILA|nr:hypothetical protein M514_10870 [Trichuris suis]
MYAYSIFLIFLLRGAEANRKNSAARQSVIYEEIPDRPRGCDEPTSLEAVLGCRFFNKTYNYNEKVIRNQIEYLCTFSKQACKVTMVPIFCLLGDARVEPGAGFAMGKLYYMCSVHENNMGIKAIGCAAEDGTRIQIGQKYRFRTFVFYCQMTQGKIEAIFIGCDNGNGIVQPGNAYDDGKATVQCQQGAKPRFPAKEDNYTNDQGERGSHTAHIYATVRKPKKSAQSMGGGRPKPVVTGQQRGWFCMDSSVSTGCRFTVSGKQYSLNRGYGEWIGEYLFFCHTSVSDGAKLCINF